jgi:GH24 family phage-related lysozyme (muramidase)
MSPDAVALLKAIETLYLAPYDDQTGKKITDWVEGATIGYGHLIAKGDWDTYKDGITASQADALFLQDLAPFEELVGETITRGLQQYEFDALVILAFNIGRSGFRSSSVAKLVNDPKAVTSYASLEDAWKAWNKSQGKVMTGLTNRRAAEWRIYTSGRYARW